MNKIEPFYSNKHRLGNILYIFILILTTLLSYFYYEKHRKYKASICAYASSVSAVILFGTLVQRSYLFLNECCNISAASPHIKIIEALCYVFSKNTLIFLTVLVFLTFCFSTDLCGSFVIINIPIYALSLNTRRIIVPEISEISEKYHLNVGHGLAYNYYITLTNFVPYKFVEKVRFFCKHHQVHVSEKLFILLPLSCHTKKYIESERIERARELPEMTFDLAGIKNRIYSITVYQVFIKLHTDSFRCAVEFAQPLHRLWELKEGNVISLNQMKEERVIFIKTMEELLNDENESYKTCVLVKYKDEYVNNGISEYEVLVETVKKYM